MLSLQPDLKAGEWMRILLESARRLPALDGRIAAAGAIDAYAAVAAAHRYRRTAGRYREANEFSSSLFV